MEQITRNVVTYFFGVSDRLFEIRNRNQLKFEIALQHLLHIFTNHQFAKIL
ncbi:Uncharacterised protein [Vibrio cholerae]|nr:Uncharacterised protein [Vibrio cholerae]